MTIPARVLDSWAILAYLVNEPSAQKVEEILLESIKAGTPLLITTVNLGEVWYSIARARSSNQADLSISQIQSMGIKVIPADWDLTNRAARFKAVKPVAYADCFAAALAEIEKAELVTGDREFKLLEKEIKVHWL